MQCEICRNDRVYWEAVVAQGGGYVVLGMCDECVQRDDVVIVTKPIELLDRNTSSG